MMRGNELALGDLLGLALTGPLLPELLLPAVLVLHVAGPLQEGVFDFAGRVGGDVGLGAPRLPPLVPLRHFLLPRHFVAVLVCPC